MTETFRSYVPDVSRTMMIRYFGNQLGVSVVELVGSAHGQALIQHLGSQHPFTVPYELLHDTWQDAERAVIALHQEEA